MTIKQLKKQYPDRWVLLLNPVWSGANCQGGQLVAFSTEELGMLSDAKRLPKGSKISVLYTGERGITDGTPIQL